MNSRFIDWIWHIRGSLALAPQQSGEDAFDRLRPLFRETGTSHEQDSDTLTFRKKDQAAQDKMAVFDGGVLQVERGAAGLVLRYHLTSRALLFCFLAPLMFLAFGQMTMAIGKFEKPAAKTEEKKKPEKAQAPMNPIDKFLGAPAPDSPEKKKADKAKEKAEDKEDEHSPTTAYVFASIFAALYVIGRILEDRKIKSLFRRKLLQP
jgi:hypothetical protein